MDFRGFNILLWVFFVHLAGIYLFSRGFLLTRLALSEISSCESDFCTLSATHKRAVVLIIDALRFDFITPNPPLPASPYHHNILTVPRELTALYPDRSLLVNAFADPPTTTLQRIKGITTGSLPTFVDVGANFGGSSIAEDSLIKQLRIADKSIAFMGDDTWMTVFPDSFGPNMSFPYDSFNVEDLHSVDEGVIRHLFPLLHDQTKPWDFMIGHFLGVDHVGHRVGPDHPKMKTKLTQMDDVLRHVVDSLDDETLLVVLGDHGMDRKGDHGGDGDLETSAGLWLYSKGPPLVKPGAKIPGYLLPEHTFPGAPVPHRRVQQVDLVPSLSLLLGLPIPFNNLGTVIPELFWRNAAGTDYMRAMNLNVRQIKRYLDVYRASPSGGELDGAWSDLQDTWSAAAVEPEGARGDSPWLAMDMFTRYALGACRHLWAQFDIVLIILGLALMATSAVMSWVIYCKLGIDENWREWTTAMTWRCVQGMAAGELIGLLAHFLLQYFRRSAGMMHYVLFGAFIVPSLIIIFDSMLSLSVVRWKSVSLPLILHAVSFTSNSFTFWEDRVLSYLLLTSIVPFVLTGFTAPTSRLRHRILGFSALFAVCVRLMAISTVCREEQQPYCHVTFFSSSMLHSPPLPVLLLVIPVSLALPFVVRRFLLVSRSERGLAMIFLPWIMPAILLQGSLFWIIEWIDSSEYFGSSSTGILRLCKTLIGWSAISGVLLGGFALWWFVPLCLEIITGTPTALDKKKRVTVIGFANAFGSPYLIFWCISFGLVYITTQLTGQIVLALGAIAVLAHLEVVDCIRDVTSLNAAFASATPSSAVDVGTLRASPAVLRFSEVVPMALLAMHVFYSTGHQATIPSIQWKSAFILTPSVTYPFSPALVLLNTFGPQFVIALAVPLLVLWNMPPLPQPTAVDNARRGSVRAALGMMLYYSVLFLGSAISSAWLRRHLMVWKVFAPRFMLAAASLLAIDFGVLVGVGLGVGRVSKRVGQVFAGMS